MSLFGRKKSEEPLAVRMRPKRLKEVVGQQHLIGEGKLLIRLIQTRRLQSAIFYGPPGTGKTTMAEVLANELEARCFFENAVEVGVKEVRAIIDEARANLRTFNQSTLLFLDEIHRFNKAQQDVLLPSLEKGEVILVGATTENPFFALNKALISRSQVFEFRPLSEEDVLELLRRALADGERGLANHNKTATDEALKFLAGISDGDARRALTALEVGILTCQGESFDLKQAEESIQKKAVVYDHDEEGHYDTISAFIKSVRGSDPDAAVYWLAKMIEAGEDPLFIARRLVILASEDIGNAYPLALAVANAGFDAVHKIGLPEARIILSQITCFLAGLPKSNAAYLAIDKALEDIRSGRVQEVPDALRVGSYKGAKDLGHGQGYQYAHDFKDHYVAQNYLTQQKTYYEPTEEGFEKQIKERLERLRKEAAEKKPGEETK